MIESVEIAGVASYSQAPETLGGLSKFNFLYGSNGSGKSTIARVLAEAEAYPSCKVVWSRGTKLEVLVYDRHFVERNFAHTSELRGVFTLGEKHVEAAAKIEKAKDELDALTKRTQNLRNTLQGEDGSGGKKAELTALEATIKDRCWTQKQKHDARFQVAFEGFRGSAEKFKAKVIQELDGNAARLLSIAELERKASTLFQAAPASEPMVAQVSGSALVAYESELILGKRILGKDDVDIAAMIQRLGNGDWVRQGRRYYDANGSICPFCQQETPASFAQSLAEYFDETFESDTRALTEFTTKYAVESDALRQRLGAIIANPSRFLDLAALSAACQLLDARIVTNADRLRQKMNEPSRVIELESVKDALARIQETVDAANAAVADHNRMVGNFAQEKRSLVAEVWRYLLDVELKKDLADFRTKKSGVEKAIDGLEKQLQAVATDYDAKLNEIMALERLVTSVRPTVDAMNGLLKSFGYTGFALAVATNGTSYRIVRADGSDARATLSEGERTFVTFLYFYHLLRGSNSEAGMTSDRVVVFDDPVSSLDSDILFIVGSLVKKVLADVRARDGHIKQVIVLTHNVYFHREVTFNPDRRDVAMNEETFWVVRKPNSFSKLERHRTNPIRTSYELLWAEVKRGDRSKLTIQNTLRRIVENYFRILGAVDPDKLCDLFDGKERAICRSFFSWVNDGSHYAHDDLHVAIDDSMIDGYLTVFRGIFEKSGHGPHYQMMMGEGALHAPPPPPTA